MQKLPNVVGVLSVPVVVRPSHTVSPGLWPLEQQATLHSLQHLQGLGACQAQCPFHKLGVSNGNSRKNGQDYTESPEVG